MCLFVRAPVCLFVRAPVCLFVRASVCLFVRASVCLFARMSVCCLFVYLCVRLFVCRHSVPYSGNIFIHMVISSSTFH